MPKSSRNRRMRTRMSGGVGPVADLTVSHGDPIRNVFAVRKRLQPRVFHIAVARNETVHWALDAMKIQQIPLVSFPIDQVAFLEAV